MPGRPKLQKLARDIDTAGLEEGFESGEDWVLDMIADGMVMRKICEALTERFEYRVTRPQLQAWIKLDEERRPKVDAAREFSAWAHAEDSGEVLEKLHEQSKRTLVTAPEVTLAKERSNWKKWYAAKLNPGELGDKAASEVHIHAGDLHLSALIEASQNAKALSKPKDEEDEDIQEADVISVEDADDPLSELR